jgi:hypothetical protein
MPAHMSFCRDVQSFVAKVLPCYHKSFAASTSKIGKTSAISDEKAICFLGKCMVLNSQLWQILLATALRKAERSTLNSWQRYDSMLAILSGKAQLRFVRTPCVGLRRYSHLA